MNLKVSKAANVSCHFKGIKMTKISKDQFQGLSRNTMENEKPSFATLPQVHGKHLYETTWPQAQQADGELKIDSEEGKGTKVNAVFKISHPDIKPIGNVLETMTALVVGNPSTHFIFDYKKGDYSYHFDSFVQCKE